MFVLHVATASRGGRFARARIRNGVVGPPVDDVDRARTPRAHTHRARNAAAARVTETTKTWTAVGAPEVSLNIEAFVQNFFNSSCESDLAARADNLLLLNDMPASSIVRINIIENSAKLNASADNVNSFFCWNYPTSCDASAERFVVNVFVDSFCASGCVAASAAAPACFGNEGCASTGTCIVACVTDADCGSATSGASRLMRRMRVGFIIEDKRESYLPLEA